MAIERDGFRNRTYLLDRLAAEEPSLSYCLLHHMIFKDISY